MTLVIASYYALMGIVFLIVRPELSYSCEHRFRDCALPRITESYALPILGPSAGSFSQSASPLFYIFWTIVFATPLVVLFFMWRAKDRVALLETAVYWGLLYAICVAIAFLFVAIGLWIPASAA